ncbi:MAG: hypothetical protein GY820_18480 [Gammaproteobacteria bacterium]|nr:hypothetical protein [Gammaproteobacteria bacterium]
MPDLHLGLRIGKSKITRVIYLFIHPRKADKYAQINERQIQNMGLYASKRFRKQAEVFFDDFDTVVNAHLF